MAFCSFSKDCDDNSYVTVENKFITKYLPEVDGFAVKVYLYGLYLCKNVDSDFSLASMAEVLKTSEERIADAFALWEDYDLVAIVSKSPFAVQYLPVKSATGRPKKVRYEQYADFNKELQRKFARIGKFVSAGDYVKYMRFLEETSLQPQALLLIAEYCINKQGDGASPSYIFNKAKKLIRGGALTYEQVERELSSYHLNEGNLLAVYAALALTNAASRVPDEVDYSLYRKWTETLGFEKDAILAAAKCLKRGNMNVLDITLEDLYERGLKDERVISEFLCAREAMASLAFRVGRKLGVKVSNPAPYIEEYIEKWCALGFEDATLLDIALFCMKNGRGSFDDMHSLVEKLATQGAVASAQVKAFLKEKNDDLKLFSKIQEICGGIRKSAGNLALIKTWRDWGFSESMLLEAAKRSVASVNPMPYMNKILTEWKETGVFEVKKIPDSAVSGGTGNSSTTRGTFTSPAVDAANAKADRERYYALLREKAQTRADKYLAMANENARFKEISAELSKMELALAKAEVFEPKTLPALSEKKRSLLSERKGILTALDIDEADLLPKFTCEKCSDTGFLKSGAACGCYKG
ncbi:MAG: DnaD domain protein [Clostridia bacterium]|nr:DnaD domain protein [Clostridia bacterium]